MPMFQFLVLVELFQVGTQQIKINVDGAFQVDGLQSGVGAVILDDKGEFLGALAKPIPKQISALATEFDGHL